LHALGCLATPLSPGLAVAAVRALVAVRPPQRDAAFALHGLALMAEAGGGGPVAWPPAVARPAARIAAAAAGGGAGGNASALPPAHAARVLWASAVLDLPLPSNAETALLGSAVAAAAAGVLAGRAGAYLTRAADAAVATGRGWVTGKGVSPEALAAVGPAAVRAAALGRERMAARHSAGAAAAEG
jgi:hypothetical protein